MKKLLFIGISLITCQLLNAQAPDTAWTRTFGGAGSEGGGEMIENTDGDYFFACTSTSNPSEQRTAPLKGARDIWVVKTDKNGTKIWDKSYGPGLITATAMTATSDGGFIVGGNTDNGIGYDKTDTARGKLDIWIIKVDRNGAKVWDKTLGGSLDDFLGEIIVAPDGSILVAINTSSAVSGDKTAPSFGGADCWVVKLNSNGQKIWDKAFGGSSGDSFYTGFVDKEGNYIFGGTSFSPVSGTKTEPSRGGNDGWLVKTDANGNKIWDKTLGGDRTDFIQCMAEAKDGGYILGIISNSNISGDKNAGNKGADDCWLVKINKSGNLVWQKTIGGNKKDNSIAIDIDDSGGIYIGLESLSDISGDKTCSFIGPGQDSWIIKTDAEGNLEWQSCYEFAALYKATLTSDNDYVLTANRNSLYIIKLENNIETDVSANYAYDNLEIFPNPTINWINIQLKDQNLNEGIEAQIIGSDGRTVQRLFLQLQNSKTQFEINLPDGIYFIKFEVNNFIYLQKFVVFNN
jgi:hypothetical protein